MLECLNIEKDNIYTYLFESFTELTDIINRVPNAFSDTKVFYAILFNRLLKEKDNKLEKFANLVFDKDYSMSEDTYWTEFKFYCLCEIEEISLSEDFSKAYNEYHIQTILEVIDQKSYKGFVYLPEFSKELKNNINNAEKNKLTCKNLERIFNRCVIRSNLPAYNLFLTELNNCFYETKKDNKPAQKCLFDVYSWLIIRTTTLINRQFLELTFEQLEDCLRELDKKRVVSNNFAATIIQDLSQMAQLVDGSTNEDLINNIIDLLFGFLDSGKELNFVTSSPETKKLLYRCLFNVGTYCIENNYEGGLRKVSNALGWLAIYSIRNTTTSHTKYILERAQELYIIANQMEVSQKTKTFLLTLFTTIGTYCCKDRTLTPFLNQIIGALQEADASVESVQTAIRLRTSENDVWNDLYEGKTSELTKRFLKAYKEKTTPKNN